MASFPGMRQPIMNVYGSSQSLIYHAEEKYGKWQDSSVNAEPIGHETSGSQRAGGKTG
jgi:hypothetical protein